MPPPAWGIVDAVSQGKGRRCVDTKKFLEDMLSEGKTLWETAGGYVSQGADYAVDKAGVAEDDPNRERYRTMVSGAAGAGALALALGTKTGGRLATLGALAALGTVAYRAYQRNADVAGEDGGEPIDAIDGPEAERRAQTLLRAMIAAARADGEIDARERAMLDEKLQSLGADAQAFFLDELMKPVDPARVATEVATPQEAREVYAASAVVCGNADPEDRAYLDRLAVLLGLPPEVAREIEGGAAAFGVAKT